MLELKGLTYSKDIHGYLLQKDYYTLRTAVSLEDVLTADNATNIDAVVNAYLYRASITFYDYVYSFNSRYKRYIQYQLCHEKDMVELVRECLLDIVNYWTVNGLDSSILNPILNVDVERSVPVVNQDRKSVV